MRDRPIYWISHASNISGDNFRCNRDEIDRYENRMIRDSVPGPRKLEANTLPVRHILIFPENLATI